MTTAPGPDGLSHEGMAKLLAVTRLLATAFELETLLATVTDAATAVLHAERCSVWLYDAAADELALSAASDIRAVRIPARHGIVGACAQARAPVFVADCYADPRFDPDVDRRSGFRTRCMLSLPLIDAAGTLVGVMQVLNRRDGVFDASDLPLAEALAAQCALALSRAQAVEAMTERERLVHELDLARAVQCATLPRALPHIPGYGLHATFLPAEQTGGDTYDVTAVPQGLLLVLGDAAGHGLGAALSVTQMHAMLKMAWRLGADLETAFREVNDLLSDTLADSRFVTAFIGLLDTQTHRVRYLSGGQGPILHWRADIGRIVHHRANSFPMGAMPLPAPRPAACIDLGPGDLLALVTDGVFEQSDGSGALFGVARVEQLLRDHHHESAAAIGTRLIDALRTYSRGTRQDDDITMLLVQRQPADAGAASAVIELT
jgi:sigma-B regulation protein RsbU (phosphoserine phosphatase)